MKFRKTLLLFMCCMTSSLLYSADNKCLSRLLPNTYEHDQTNGVLIGKYTAFIVSDDNHNRSCAWKKILDHHQWHGIHEYEKTMMSIHKLYCLWRTYEVRAYLPKQAQQQQKKDDSNETKQ
jgi:hypothetical protein